MIEAFAERYRRDLTESVIPFWLKHSLDRECGGYFTCLDRDGAVYDDRKYVWLQGREVWMFSRLYNAFERRQEYLDAAALGVSFIRRYARDPKGRVYFSLTREGRPFFYQRKPYGAVFCALGLLEYSRAAGDRACREEAEDLFWRIVEWVADPSLLDRPALDGQPPTRSLANAMVLASMAIEFAAGNDDPRYVRVMRDAAEAIARHYDPDRRILMEYVAEDGSDLKGWPEGRLFNPGHSVETAWFLLHLQDHVPDLRHRRLAFDALEGSLELGWDAEYGGIYYFMDMEGRPTLQLESTMKLWWPHTEAIYGLVLAYCLTGEDRWLAWLERVDRYAYGHFADPEYGEWFGYCDRHGNPTHTCKGGSYKGCFHVPRALLMSVERIDHRRGGGT